MPHGLGFRSQSQTLMKAQMTFKGPDLCLIGLAINKSQLTPLLALFDSLTGVV